MPVDREKLDTLRAKLRPLLEFAVCGKGSVGLQVGDIAPIYDGICQAATMIAKVLVGAFATAVERSASDQPVTGNLVFEENRSDDHGLTFGLKVAGADGSEGGFRMNFSGSEIGGATEAVAFLMESFDGGTLSMDYSKATGAYH
jgi:hypothetical protein